MRCFWVLLPVLLLSACSTFKGGGAAPADKLDSEAPHINESEIHTDLIKQMLDKGQYYAALAHIEDQKRTSER